MRRKRRRRRNRDEEEEEQGGRGLLQGLAEEAVGQPAEPVVLEVQRLQGDVVQQLRERLQEVVPRQQPPQTHAVQ